MGRVFIVFLLIINSLFAVEQTLGGISLGTSYKEFSQKYPELAGDSFTALEETHLPYPLLLVYEGNYRIAQSADTNVQYYFNNNQNIVAIVTTYRKNPNDKYTYATSLGLKPGDGPIELKLLYGLPQDISEYKLQNIMGEALQYRLYYYPNLCIQTQKVNDGDEYIDMIVLGEYNMQLVLQRKNKRQFSSTKK